MTNTTLTTAEKAAAAFDWPNDKWALMFLPWVRAAVVQKVAHETEVESFVRDGGDELRQMLEGWNMTANHLLDLCDILHAVTERLTAAAKRLGVEVPPDYVTH